MAGTGEKLALIGAGPMGLVTARNLSRLGLAFDGFEIHEDVGGLWDIDNPQSTMYESAHLISSKTQTELAEFPMAERVADYPHHREVCDYFRAYADHFDLRSHFRFGARVLRAERKASGWRLTWEQGGEEQSASYRGLLIANGTLSEPNLPSFEGELTGELLHSSKYRSPDLFDGKRVLIIGAGNSGCDIAVDAVHRARKVAMSLRRGYHFVPKYIFGRPADTVGGFLKMPRILKQRIDGVLLRWFTGDPQRLGFPTPDHRLYESHPIVNSLVLYHAGHGDLEVRADVERYEGPAVCFRDGTRDEFDLVLLATGYRLHFPFLDQEELNWRGAAPHLYLNCFHPRHDDLFVMGMIEAAGLGWQGRFEQAELVARYLVETEKGSAAAERFRRRKQEPFADMRGGWRYVSLDRMAYYVHKDTYRSTVRRHIRELGG